MGSSGVHSLQALKRYVGSITKATRRKRLNELPWRSWWHSCHPITSAGSLLKYPNGHFPYVLTRIRVTHVWGHNAVILVPCRASFASCTISRMRDWTLGTQDWKLISPSKRTRTRYSVRANTPLGLIGLRTFLETQIILNSFKQVTLEFLKYVGH